MDFLANYGLFFAKVFTVLIAILVVVLVLAGLRMRDKSRPEGQIEVRHWNDKIRRLKEALQVEVLDKLALKQLAKQEKLLQKQKAKEQKQRLKLEKQETKQAKAIATESDSDVSQSAEPIEGAKQNVYVINFHGDIRAQSVDNLREEITAILSMASPNDEVIIRIGKRWWHGALPMD